MSTPHTDDHSTESHWSKFPDEERVSLLGEDSSAWNAVTKILLTIVAIGLSLSFLTLYLSK